MIQIAKPSTRQSRPEFIGMYVRMVASGLDAVNRNDPEIRQGLLLHGIIAAELLRLPHGSDCPDEYRRKIQVTELRKVKPKQFEAQPVLLSTAVEYELAVSAAQGDPDAIKALLGDLMSMLEDEATRKFCQEQFKTRAAKARAAFRRLRKMR